MCANRIFVQRGAYDGFASEFTRQVSALRVGNGFTPGIDIGPLIDRAAADKVAAHVGEATAGGARILAGGAAWGGEGGEGAFWTPTVLGDVRPTMQVAVEETFGPVAPLIPFDTEDEVVELANDMPFGLAGYFFTRDVRRVFGWLNVWSTALSARMTPCHRPRRLP